jgi:hypothetical protein
MAYIDTSYLSPQNTNVSGGAPTGGGTGLNVSANVGAGATGSAGVGSGFSVSSWVIWFFVITFGILITTGVIFNKKGA